jgi:hypothetical protein
MRPLTLVLITATAALAASPDFTGTWKLNISKSDFGQFPPPSSMTQKVTHAEPKLTATVIIASDMGEFEFTFNCTTDAKECTNQGFGGAEFKSVAKWDGDSLVTDSKGALNDMPFTIKDKWTLSEAGKVFTILRHLSSSMGEMDQRYVFEKQ